MDHVKLGCANAKICWAIFIVLNIITLIFMIGTVGTKKWAKLEAEDEGYAFEGSISTFHEVSLSLMAYEDEPYENAADDWCDAADLIKSDLFEAGCAMFSALSVCCCCFWTFELLSVAYIITNIVSLSVFYCRCDIIWLSLISVILSDIWHFMAYILHSSGNRLSYDDTCDKFRDEHKPEPLCAEDGPALALFVFLFMVIFGVFQCIFICIYYNRKKHMGIPMSTFQNHQPPPAYPTALPAYPQPTEAQMVQQPYGQAPYPNTQQPQYYPAGYGYNQPPQQYNQPPPQQYSQPPQQYNQPPQYYNQPPQQYNQYSQPPQQYNQPPQQYNQPPQQYSQPAPQQYNPAGSEAGGQDPYQPPNDPSQGSFQKS